MENTNFIEDIILNDMQNNKTAVITRFPPEPNGFLHIGHVKACNINFSLSEKFGGHTNLRLDDTNPSKEDSVFAGDIIDCLKWLGFNYKNLNYTSDYYDRLYQTAVDFIKKGLAYVCDLTPQQININRGTLKTVGKNSPYRDRSIEENLTLFEKMKNGAFSDGEKCLRAKIDMASPNMNLRDPVMYRINKTPHHRTGSKWNIYPMYDFAQPISDLIEGVTYSLASIEFEDHIPLYMWFVQNSNFENKNVKRITFEKLKINRSILGKRNIKQLVDAKVISGWDDPRLLTVSGMKRRGYTPAAIKAFVSSLGVSKANSTAELYQLEYFVREELNKTAQRLMAVVNPLRVVLTNVPDNFEAEAEIENNPTDLAAGNHKIKLTKVIYIEREDFKHPADKNFFRLTLNGCVRLKGSFIIRCNKINYGKNDIESLECELVKDESVKVKSTIQFVSEGNYLPCRIRMFGHLLKEGIEVTDDNLAECINPESVTEFNGMVESYVKNFGFDDKFQFMRTGYFVLDKESKGNGLAFNLTVKLKS